MKILASFSGGKDSMLSLDRAIDEGNTPVGLMVTTNSEGLSWFHDINVDILEKVSESLQIPIFFCPCKMGEKYTQDYDKILMQLVVLTGAKACVFGDIDIEEHRAWCQERADKAKITALFPLWQESRVELVNEFLEKGYKTLIKKVNKNFLSPSYLGKTLSKELLEKFEKIGIDPCGENGEYHTLVYDGPKFTKKVNLKLGNISENENCHIREIELA
ncbi:MAG: diphthine--ammonia ligase [Proteocatella sp.]